MIFVLTTSFLELQLSNHQDLLSKCSLVGKFCFIILLVFFSNYFFLPFLVLVIRSAYQKFKDLHEERESFIKIFDLENVAIFPEGLKES